MTNGSGMWFVEGGKTVRALFEMGGHGEVQAERMIV